MRSAASSMIISLICRCETLIELDFVFSYLRNISVRLILMKFIRSFRGIQFLKKVLNAYFLKWMLEINLQRC